MNSTIQTVTQVTNVVIVTSGILENSRSFRKISKVLQKIFGILENFQQFRNLVSYSHSSDT